ncbi:MAG: DUF938 domain-containing protein [Amphritea sp.]
MELLNYSLASERNQSPVLEVLAQTLRPGERVLEVGSGSGQHALHFCTALPSIEWQPTELAINLDALRSNLLRYGSNNIHSPCELDVDWPNWPVESVSAVYTANTLHIISWAQVESFFQGVGACLESGGLLIIYGPFRYNEQFTSPSNAQFDQWLKQRDPVSGIRDIEQIERQAAAQCIELLKDCQMPANNQLLVCQKR